MSYSARPFPQSAILFMFVAMSFIPAADTAGKMLSAELGVAPIYVAWSRFLIGAVILLPFLPKGTWALFGDWRIWLRASLMAIGLSCIQMALAREPIADVFAAFFIGPLVSYVLAMVFLGEAIKWQGTALVLLGFIGVLIIVQPSMDMGVGLIWAVAAGMCYGAFLTASRWLSHLGTPLGLTFSQLFISTVLLTPLGIFHIPTLTPQVAGLTVLSALFSMLGNLILLYAYKVAPATRLAPLVYFQLLAAVVLGWIVFETLPDVLTWVGLLIVMGAGIASTRVRD